MNLIQDKLGTETKIPKSVYCSRSARQIARMKDIARNVPADEKTSGLLDFRRHKQSAAAHVSLPSAQGRSDHLQFPVPMSLQEAFAFHMKYSLAIDPFNATPHHVYLALSLAIKDIMIRRWIETQRTYYFRDVKQVYYFSMEFLLGRTLGNSIINLGLYRECQEMLGQTGYDLEELEEQEADAGLGNGGLGRLAACFLDSMATLGFPAHGCGIRFDFGVFRQHIKDGLQVEEPDDWLHHGNPWQIARSENTFRIKFCGRVERAPGVSTHAPARWVESDDVLAVPFDMLIPGYANHTVNTLSLWSARSVEPFDMESFKNGDYLHAIEHRALSENISHVLYPEDQTPAGRELRLKQEYFLVSASLQDILRRYCRLHGEFMSLPRKVAIQLNDTHPALAIPELMRLLVDEYSQDWNEAWKLTVKTFGYTNHTVMPEALEQWPVELLGRLLPRHLEIIYDINDHFLRQAALRHPGDAELIRRISLIDERPERKVRMANLAVVGSHAVNGVSALHTDLLKRKVMSDFYELYPARFQNKTNGITPRRWLGKCNPALAKLISARIGQGWLTHLDELHRLEELLDNSSFRCDWRAVKRANKVRLAEYILGANGVTVDPDSLFDCQAKRFHEYKRQDLNLLHVIHRYRRLRLGEKLPQRTVILAGKAASGYFNAKLMIKLANNLAAVINDDPMTRNSLKVVFLANYGVSLAEKLVSAADLSQQISCAGMEASGTSNMKFALNGALTLGTMDGANVEILQAVGEENFFLCGMNAEMVSVARSDGYNPRRIYEENAELRACLDELSCGRYSDGDTRLFQPLVDTLLNRDEYMVLADFDSYLTAQARADAAYADRERWAKSSILNSARMGFFSADRAVREYAEDIWDIEQIEC